MVTVLCHTFHADGPGSVCVGHFNVDPECGYVLWNGLLNSGAFIYCESMWVPAWLHISDNVETQRYRRMFWILWSSLLMDNLI